MYFRNVQGNFRNAADAKLIAVRPVRERHEAAINTPATVEGETRWRVYVDTDSPANRVGDYDSEERAREVAEKLAQQVGVVDVGNEDQIDTQGYTDNN